MINKEKWAELIKDFNPKELPESFEREIVIPLKTPLNRAVSIIGPRRAGKTYLMFNLIKKISFQYPSERILYMNFEKAGFLPLDSNELVLMKETFFEIYPNTKKKDTWFFLDEIQNVSDWEVFVRTCLDENIHVFISGSSSKLLSKDIASAMRGRTLTYLVLPFSFKEYVLSQNFKIEKFFSSSQKQNILNLFNNYLVNGGYPEVIVYPSEKEKILSNIFETALYKDVIEKEKIRNTKAILHLIQALISSKEFSTNKFYNYLKSLGFKIGKNALYNYASYFENAFFVFLLKKFSFSYKKAEQSLPKVYLVDNGILTINYIYDKGRLLENLVFLELIRRGKEISYFQTANKNEVDFVVRQGKKVKQLIQVCYDLSDFQTLDREINSLILASKEFSCNDLILLSMSKQEEKIVASKKIKIIPVWKWLLNLD